MTTHANRTLSGISTTDVQIPIVLARSKFTQKPNVIVSCTHAKFVLEEDRTVSRTWPTCVRLYVHPRMPRYSVHGVLTMLNHGKNNTYLCFPPSELCVGAVRQPRQPLSHSLSITHPLFLIPFWGLSAFIVVGLRTLIGHLL